MVRLLFSRVISKIWSTLFAIIVSVFRLITSKAVGIMVSTSRLVVEAMAVFLLVPNKSLSKAEAAAVNSYMLLANHFLVTISLVISLITYTS